MSRKDCLIAAGLSELEASQLDLETKTKAELQDQIYWVSQQQRTQAFNEFRKREAIDAMNTFIEEGATPTQALMALISRADPRFNTRNNVEAAAKFRQGQYASQMKGLIDKFRSRPSLKLQDLFNSGDPEGEALLVKAIHGEKIDDPDIEAFAKEWGELRERMRQDFNTAGGWIDKNEDWLMPQSWDAATVKKRFKTPEEWVEYMWTRVDRDKMMARDVIPATTKGGKATSLKSNRVMNDDELRAALTESYDSIINFGANKIDPMKDTFLGRRGIATKYNQERVIHIKGADNWSEIHRDLGRGGSVFDLLMGHTERMGSDVAVLETLPPVAYEAAKSFGNTKGGFGQTRVEQLDAMYAVVSGRLDMGSAEGVADALEATRNVITFSKLGSALLMATADNAFMVKTAQFNGLSPAQVLGKQMSALFGDSDDLMKKALEIGMTADAWSMTANSNARFGEHALDGATGKMARTVLKASGLSSWTHAGRVAFQMEFNYHLGRNMGKTWDELDPTLQTAMKRYDIDSKGWDAFRAQELREDGLIDMTTSASRDMHRLIMTESDFAVPTPDARARAYTTGGKGRNTVTGQGIRTIMNLKTFPITVMTSHWQRMAHDKYMTSMDKVGYAAQLMAHTTIMGAMVVYSKELLAGKEARPLEEAEQVRSLLVDGMLAGGSLGLVGDILLRDPTAYGKKGLGDQLVSNPTIGVFNDITKISGVGRMWEDDYDFEKHKLDATKAIGRNMPGVWWTTPLTKAISQELEDAIAPVEAPARRGRAEKEEQKEYGRGYR